MESALTTKGQITIPKIARDRLHLNAGDRVKFFFHPDGYLAILPKLPASALKGIVPALGRPVSIEEMNKEIANAATKCHRRFLAQ